MLPFFLPRVQIYLAVFDFAIDECVHTHVRVCVCALQGVPVDVCKSRGRQEAPCKYYLVWKSEETPWK